VLTPMFSARLKRVVADPLQAKYVMKGNCR
jgi:hypothetical protein